MSGAKVAFQFTRAGERATEPCGERDGRTSFNSRALGSARLAGSMRQSILFVSIHARWGARDEGGGRVAGDGAVSIHARWGARDAFSTAASRAVRFQFTRAGERATKTLDPLNYQDQFQFTRAGERATVRRRRWRWGGSFNSRALGSARLWSKVCNMVFTDVSIHARWGARDNCASVIIIFKKFQFTRAGERATDKTTKTNGENHVSIHARWGARDFIATAGGLVYDVSIHARWGARDRPASRP